MTSFQKRLAAKVMGVGVSKVWLDPVKMKDVEKAITRIDIKKLLKQGAIKKIPDKIPMPKKKRTRHGEGSRKGSPYARVTKKQRWVHTVRPMRRMLVELKDSEKIDHSTYRKMRMLVKGGMFRSRSHLKIYLEQHKLVKK
ncbi:50S ribosomal protein L19e [archaeon]|nr:MAG: 50S ribosomal protein L19e [archaeon]